MDDPRRAYIELIKRAVSNYLYLGGEAPFARYNALAHYDKEAGGWKVDPLSRPATLLGQGQLDLIERCVHDVVERGVPGDFIEAGVWRGGAVILLRALLGAHGITGRTVVAADSFSGIPKNTRFKHDPVDLWEDRWAAPLAEVQALAERFGLADERIEWLPGLFEDTLPTLEGRQFALIRLDSDSYDSVQTSLDRLYPLLSPGGIVIVDDWHLPGCRFAVADFRKRSGVEAEVHEEAGNGWWVKG